MTDDRQRLFDLLSERVLDDDPPRTPWKWWIGGAGAVLAIGITLALSGGSEPAADTAALSTTPGGVPIDTTTPTTDPAAPTTLPAPAYPSGRLHPSMVGTPAGIVMFGGREGSRARPLSETWLRDPAGEWTLAAGTLQPPPRDTAPIAYDAASGRVVLIGGTPDPVQGCGLGFMVSGAVVDTWTFDPIAAEWERLVVRNAPSDRWGHAVAADPVSGRIVLFGGAAIGESRGIAATLDDTWVLDVAAGEWTLLDPPVHPSGRACHAMVTDPDSGLVYLWGGQTSLSVADDELWVFDFATGTWTGVEQADPPEGRWLHRLVADPRGGGIYLIAGFGPRVTVTDSGTITALESLGDVWRFDIETLTWESRTPLPLTTTWHAAAGDGEGRVVVFSFDRTFLYDPGGDAWLDVTPDLPDDA